MSEMVEKLRNVALVSHVSCGKTSLAEAMLFKAGATNRLGSVDQGNSVLDFEPEELKRSITINTAFHQYTWKKHTINIIDTPGDQDFFSDTKLCLEAAGTALVLIDAVDGVKVQTNQAWEFAKDYELPCIIVINKLDRERADFNKVFEEMSEILEPKPIKIHLPIGQESDFSGVVNLITMKAHLFDQDGNQTISDIPADMKDDAEMEREAFVENIAEADDSLLEKYLEGEELEDEEILSALRTGVRTRAFAPVLCTAATKLVGVEPLMDFIVQSVPSPLDWAPRKGKEPGTDNEIERAPDPDAPFSAFVFKTISDPYAGRLSIFRVVSGTLEGDGNFYNPNKEIKERYTQLLRLAGKDQKPAEKAVPGSIVAVAKLKETTTGDTLCDESAKIIFETAKPLPTSISYAVSPKSKGDEDKIFSSLSRMLEEDQSLKLTRSPETNEILLSGLGQVHIEVTSEKLKRKFNVEVNLDLPKVPYKETIKKKVRVQGRHKKQTGGHGQFGDCWIQMEPLPRGEGYEFVDAIVGGAIPKTYIPAVDKGIQESSRQGVLAGFPCVDFKVKLDDGSYHAVDSSEMAFKVAGSLAFKKALAEANPVLLEPIMKITITTPEEYMGDIMGDLNGKRGRVLGMDSQGKNQIISAYVPMAEFQTYAPDLRSMTGGRGMFTIEFSHYDEVPANLADKIIEEAKKEKE